MPGNSQRRGRRTSSKKGASMGSGGQRRAGLKGRGRTLPADERPWHKGYSGDEPLPERTAWKQEKERRAPAAAPGGPQGGGPGGQPTPPQPPPQGGPAPEAAPPPGPPAPPGRRHPAGR